MKLHVFNPGHDLALASDKVPFTPPHAARRLQHDLSFIAAVWADDGDMVLVDDKEAAKESLKRIGLPSKKVIFIERQDMPMLKNVEFEDICVWGWDKAIKRQLKDMGVSGDAVFPSDETLDIWRNISARAWAAEHILDKVTAADERFVGVSRKVTDVVDALGDGNGQKWVLKSPWSCSGRGVRYVKKGGGTPHLEGWVRNVINKQGYIMAEPFYSKLCDLALEFFSDGCGNVKYLGLSIFETRNGAYTGNVIAPEERKRRILSRHIPLDLLDKATSCLLDITAKELGSVYRGIFGIDMMVVADNDKGVCLHPCVEMNLRRTMGYVALCIDTSPYIQTKVMRIESDKLIIDY